ncbi:ferrochelatase [Lysobacter sp. CFH 32150]|uniref:ferrochelatase n=1 Tax=Lysobacter sp. CFH 32150 TaxID=2927128 RepID=UPI001FA729CD|nr:ferrochelatase [Lysobacter sp. CFH 32150]MCI4567903.1 ferrochelatase [Lysobacter sp. CFH 32150]
MSHSDTALLLVNLGTPAAPTPRAVRHYLAEFLSDPRVVQLPQWLWQPLLRGVILPLRGARVARKYAEIWMDAGSPLAVHTRELAAVVQQQLPQLRVAHAMRYGEPALAATLATLRDEGIRRVLALPLYPQYSTTTTASVADVLAGAKGIETRLVSEYHLDAGWIAAIAASIHAHWQVHGRGEKLVLSFHGIPQRLVDDGDPYATQCEASVAAIARTLGLRDDEFMLTYQSRFGREAWLQPATQATLQSLAADSVRRVDVVCPGFAVDCLETLEEIAMVNAEAFRSAGGEALHYIPCLNATPAHADALAALAQRQLAAW